LNQALALFESLVEVDPQNYRYLIAPAAIHGMIGDLLKAKDDLSGALKRFKTALDVSRYAAQNMLGDAQAQRKIALYLNKLGDTLNGLDDHPAAKQHYLEFLEIAKNPQNRSAFSGQRMRDIAVVEIKLGLVAEGNKETNEAIRRYQSARVLIERLAVDFPENDILREDLGWLKRKLERLIERRDADIRRQLRETQKDQTV
jgi:tetratricopeptide (TPR) repeat protein